MARNDARTRKRPHATRRSTADCDSNENSHTKAPNNLGQTSLNHAPLARAAPADLDAVHDPRAIVFKKSTPRHAMCLENNANGRTLVRANLA